VVVAGVQIILMVQGLAQALLVALVVAAGLAHLAAQEIPQLNPHHKVTTVE